MDFLKTDVKKNPYKVASKTKWLRVNVTKEMSDMYTDNNKRSRRNVKKNQVNGKIACVYRLKELILLICP